MLEKIRTMEASVLDNSVLTEIVVKDPRKIFPKNVVHSKKYSVNEIGTPSSANNG